MVRIARHRDSMLIIIVVAVVSVACVSACTNERQHSNCAHHSHSPEREKNVQNKNEIALCCCLLLLLLNVCVRWSIVSFLFHWFVTSIRTQTYYHQLFLSLSLSHSHTRSNSFSWWLELMSVLMGASQSNLVCSFSSHHLHHHHYHLVFNKRMAPVSENVIDL